jgi:hypothetical protein
MTQGSRWGMEDYSRRGASIITRDHPGGSTGRVLAPATRGVAVRSLKTSTMEAAIAKRNGPITTKDNVPGTHTGCGTDERKHAGQHCDQPQSAADGIPSSQNIPPQSAPWISAITATPYMPPSMTSRIRQSFAPSPLEGK